MRESPIYFVLSREQLVAACGNDYDNLDAAIDGATRRTEKDGEPRVVVQQLAQLNRKTTVVVACHTVKEQQESHA
ncbi:hypothetical protein KWH04_01015 [Xanthomonas campestris pv. trichodesmae]|uniref:Uncharacterized protein n=2 Tax=Xanthomonas citri TaxID=346 RepID=A0AB33CLL3_XANCI|nr:hypothetical protein [Xanthomonas citri]ASK91078.1 hypothetical protein XcvCFBP7111P_05795 [Xanthomonas citri pv. vignicola]MBV6779250.1 hypothetical protein [Xanthomonas campestris pv. trichodesmae]MBZ3921764.1 hypothetical protein [Xanthomonas campestris pv. trichodesmae]MBZ3926364.1 hypothetical protein [Xanthomonas citri pv. sesbaniae]